MKYAAVLLALLGAQDVNYDILHKKCGTEIKWITDPPYQDGIRRALPECDRLTLLDEARAKARQAKKPIFWYAYRFAGPQMYRPNLVDSYMMQTVFCDEDVVNMINLRCIPLRLACDRSITEVTKLKALDVVEPAVVLLDAEGTVLWKIDRIRTFDADWFAYQIREALKKHAPIPSTDSVDDLLRLGDFEAARGQLEKKSDAKSKYLLATVYRRLREPDKARAALAEAKNDAATAPLAQVEEALLAMKQGKFEEARKGFDQAAACERSPEAKYFRACIDFLSGREKEAFDTWKELAGDSRWGWKSASQLTKHKDTTPDGAMVHSFETLTWGADATYTPLSTTVWGRTEKDIDDLSRRAVEFLLRHQRADGSWSDTRYAFWDTPAILPNVRVAVTALSAAALLEWRSVEPDRIDKAIEKAEKYILDEAHMARGRNEEIYADGYKLLYLSKKNSQDAVASMNAVVEKLARRQSKDGYWAHEYPNAFCTAAVVQCLMLAKKAGAKVPDKMIKLAGEALKDSRSANGTFGYDSGRGGNAPAKDSSARSALCESALLLVGESGREAVAKALEDYWKFYDRQERVRKCDFHSDGELGGFFFLHGLFHTTEAVKLLDEKERAEQLQKFLAQIVKLPEIDGSFIDDHEMGKSYGTAVALLALKNASGRK
jgi:tetratricopeptide (TPR) repeat protein